MQAGLTGTARRRPVHPAAARRPAARLVRAGRPAAGRSRPTPTCAALPSTRRPTGPAAPRPAAGSTRSASTGSAGPSGAGAAGRVPLLPGAARAASGCWPATCPPRSARRPAGRTARRPTSSCVLGVQFWQNSFKYNSFSYHVVTMDTGALLQTWRMWAHARGLRVDPVLWFDEPRLTRLLGVDPAREGLFAVVPLRWEGRPDDGDPVPGPRVRRADAGRSRTVLDFPMVRDVHASTVDVSGRPDPAALAGAAPAPVPPGGERVGLPAPAPLDVDVRAALRRRRSSFGRFTGRRPTSPAELAAVLAAAAAGAALPTDATGAGLPLASLHVFVNHVAGIPPGSYRHDPATGELRLVRSGPPGEFLQRNYFLANYNLEQAGAVVVPAVRTGAVLDAVRRPRLPAGQRAVGASCQAVYTAAAALGLGLRGGARLRQRLLRRGARARRHRRGAAAADDGRARDARRGRLPLRDRVTSVRAGSPAPAAAGTRAGLGDASCCGWPGCRSRRCGRCAARPPPTGPAEVLAETERLAAAGAALSEPLGALVKAAGDADRRQLLAAAPAGLRQHRAPRPGGGARPGRRPARAGGHRADRLAGRPAPAGRAGRRRRRAGRRRAGPDPGRAARAGRRRGPAAGRAGAGLADAGRPAGRVPRRPRQRDQGGQADPPDRALGAVVPLPHRLQGQPVQHVHRGRGRPVRRRRAGSGPARSGVDQPPAAQRGGADAAGRAGRGRARAARTTCR